MNKQICKSCNTENIEMHWHMDTKDRWICLWCYNGTYSDKQIKKFRKYKIGE